MNPLNNDSVDTTVIVDATCHCCFVQQSFQQSDLITPNQKKILRFCRIRSFLFFSFRFVSFRFFFCFCCCYCVVRFFCFLDDDDDDNWWWWWWLWWNIYYKTAISNSLVDVAVAVAYIARLLDRILTYHSHSHPNPHPHPCLPVRRPHHTPPNKTAAAPRARGACMHGFGLLFLTKPNQTYIRPLKHTTTQQHNMWRHTRSVQFSFLVLSVTPPYCVWVYVCVRVCVWSSAAVLLL